MSESNHQWQVLNAVGAGLTLLLLCLVLAACGKRPSTVDPPPTVEDDTFPLAYPDISTDPKPEGAAK